MAAVQHQDHALLFLCSHDLEEAEHYGLDTSFLVAPLQTGAVSLTSASDGDSLNTDAEALVTILGKQITLTYNSTSANPGTFTGKYTRVTSQPPDTTNRKGFFYWRGSLPDTGKNTFWVQQYPAATAGEKSGRLTIEFWTNSQIVGVYKSSEDNLGAQGDGNWV